MGSVKDLEVVQAPTDDRMGIGRFHFSDRYSVFDWGEMPDTIPRKGAALCMIAAHAFESARRIGIKTHYRHLVVQGSQGEYTSQSVDEPTATMEVSLVRVLRPAFANGTYDYSAFADGPTNVLIPLEIIYRNALPAGSSVFKRLQRGEIKPADLGLDHEPHPGERLEKPVFDVSTKLEPTDRYLSWKDAQRLAGLSGRELRAVLDTLGKINLLNTRLAELAGNLENVDGKIELAYDAEGELMVVDVFGTPDECRFIRDGVHVSKESARNFYRKTEWYKAVETAKAEAKRAQDQDWKKFCALQPPELDPVLKHIISDMYQAMANGVLKNRAFGSAVTFEAPPLDKVIRDYKSWEAAHA